MKTDQKVLIIAAHPDDEIIGCGGTIVEHMKVGNEVAILIITEASMLIVPEGLSEYNVNKYKAQVYIDNMLGTKRFHLYHKTVELNTIPHGYLSKQISDMVKDIKPDIVFTHHINDLNLDHEIVARASMVACRPQSGVKKLLMYEIITNTEFSIKPFNPNYYISFSSDTLAQKVHAFEFYDSEKNKSRNRWRLENQAVMRGHECNKDFAEAFQLVRCIE